MDLTTPLAFLLVLGVIIFVHEFGHFITAKAFGIRVFIFSFGFGRRLFGFKWGDTDCRLSLVPLGGYVKLEGEPDDHISERQDQVALADGELVRIDSPDYFLNRPRWQRFLVYVAGPAMNAVLTVAGFSVLFMLGWSPDGALAEPPVIGVVEAGSPAEGAALAPGDEILAIDGQRMPTWEDAQVAILLRPERDLTLRVRAGSGEREVRLRSRAEGEQRAGSIGVTPLVRIGEVSAGLPAQQAGLRAHDGVVSIDGAPIRSFDDIVKAVRGARQQALAFRVYRDQGFETLSVTPREGRIGVASAGYGRGLSFFPAIGRAFRQTWRATVQTVTMLRDLMTARISPRAGLAGPIGIARLSGEAARTSPLALLYVITMISLSVGILNLFPLAPLDGGHLAILAGEGLIRRDFSLTVKAWIMNAGAIVLFLLIGLVLYSDLSKTALLQKYLP